MIFSSSGLRLEQEVDSLLAWDYIQNGYLLAPQTVLKGRKKNPLPIFEPVVVDRKTIVSAVEELIKSSLGNIARAHRAVMFSGGFDSMLMALLTKQCGANVTAMTIRFEDFNPMTVYGAAQAAQELGISHHVLEVTSVEFICAFEALASLTNEPILDLDLAVVYAALKKYDRSIAGDIFISGMGSDQWFGNMALEDWPGGFEGRLDWAIIDQDAHQKAAQHFGCKFTFPFLSQSMLELSQSLPDDMKKDKKLLRALAVANAIPHRGVRSEIQVPDVMKRILVKKFGDRAWPSSVSVRHSNYSVDDKLLRQIILGLWLEKFRKA
jgi:asparagine synthetase B (glutamine-hydrolysing)